MGSRSPPTEGAREPSTNRGAPRIDGLLETAVYVDDLERADRFYGDVLGLERVLDTPRMMTYIVAPAQVLLVFRRGMTEEDSETAGGVVPGHHSEGPAHFAFAIEAGAYEAWKRHLEAAGVPIISQVRWSKGGRSLYFNDPDGNVLEMATPGSGRTTEFERPVAAVKQAAGPSNMPPSVIG